LNYERIKQTVNNNEVNRSQFIIYGINK